MRNFLFIIFLLAIPSVPQLLLAKGASCMKAYTQIYSDKSTFGPQLFTYYLKQLIPKFKSAHELSDEGKISYFLRSDIRIIFFKLQSLARTYAKNNKHYDSFFTPYKEYFKKFEDLYGQLDLQNTMLGLALKTNEPALIEHFTELKMKAGEALLAELHTDGFMESRLQILEKVTTDIANFSDWKKPKKDKDIFIEVLISDTKSLIKKIKDREFTNDDIELGLHELRRKIRWLVILVQSLNGLTKYVDDTPRLSANVNNLYHQFIITNPNLLNSSFLKTRDSDIDKPILIPQISHALISEIVTQIGSRKDKAEASLYLLEAAKKLRFSQQQVQAIKSIINKHFASSENTDHKEQAEYYQQLLEESKLLENYLHILEDVN